MYVVTFYSFKGGVGRTFALVNVATALARTGRKVLMVDFDLEAPGIQTFDRLQPKQPHPGVVEYVFSYLTTGSSPDVNAFVYETERVAEDDGRLWVMPAGTGDREYRQKLAGIHWQRLYSESDGYLMIEDLKEQWRSAFAPDYVFVDSRTGHTDVEGICTRQLADAVVLLFFPNEQNLAGLREVVNDIRSEAKRSRSSAPPLHFVVSNVPELDDEDDILRKRLEVFCDELDFSRNSLRWIRNYPSLSLVNQSIFAIDRPRSRLTREYLQLKDSIIENNMEDREAAAAFLRGGKTPFGYRRFDAPKINVEERINAIRDKHSNDGELLFLIAMLRKDEGKPDEARKLVEKAIESGFRSGAALLERARYRLADEKVAEAVKDLKEALARDDLSEEEAELAVRLVGDSRVNLLNQVPQSPSVKALPPDKRLSIAKNLTLFDDSIALAVRMLRELLQDENLSSMAREIAKSDLTLCLIGIGAFEDAMTLLCPVGTDWMSLDLADTFNYSMSLWGKFGQAPMQLFTRIVELSSNSKIARPKTANFYQCIALAYACLQRSEEAYARLAEAIERIGLRDREFSCWRYRTVTPEEFAKDCEAIRGFIEGRILTPAFITRNEKV